MHLSPEEKSLKSRLKMLVVTVGAIMYFSRAIIAIFLLIKSFKMNVVSGRFRGPFDYATNAFMAPEQIKRCYFL